MVILFDLFNIPEDIFEVIFATKQQIVVAKLLINHIKENGSEIGKSEMSLFATKLHDGELVADPLPQPTRVLRSDVERGAHRVGQASRIPRRDEPALRTDDLRRVPDVRRHGRHPAREGLGHDVGKTLANCRVE